MRIKFAAFLQIKTMQNKTKITGVCFIRKYNFCISTISNV